MTSPHDTFPPDPALTGAERRCLALAAIGRTPAEIARDTDLSVERVVKTLRTATDRLGARNLAGAISRAVRLDLI